MSFLYKTVRAEWWVHMQPRITRNIVFHGPYASEEEAYRQVEILKSRELSKHKYSVHYQETDVDIDPILTETVQAIIAKIESVVDDRLLIKKKRSKTPTYFHEQAIKLALKNLTKEISEQSFTLHLENPNA